jgi:hypothetical protein
VTVFDWLSSGLFAPLFVTPTSLAANEYAAFSPVSKNRLSKIETAHKEAFTMQQESLSKYDRLYGGLHDVGLSSKPSTVKNVQTITGKSETFVVQTIRHHEYGDHIFIECMDESGVIRLALPPKVSNLIASQREALTKRRRSISSKTAIKARIAAGEVFGFAKKKVG